MPRSTSTSGGFLTTSAGAIGDYAYGTFVIVARNFSVVANANRDVFDLIGKTFLVRVLTTTGLIQATINGRSARTAPTVTMLEADGQVLLAVTKETGTVPIRFHRHQYSTNTWIHEDATSTTADATSGTTTGATLSKTTSGFSGRTTAAAFFQDKALTDAQIESMAYSLQTWLALQPTAMWVFDQSDTSQSVIDWTGGGANQASITGTSIPTEATRTFGWGHPVLIATRDSGGGGGGSVSGTATAPLSGVSGSVTGVRTVFGANAAPLPSLAASAVAVRSVFGAATSLLGGVSGSASVGTVSGSAAITLPRVTGAALGLRAVVGSAAITLPRVTGAALGLRTVVGSAAITLPRVTGTALVDPPDTAPIFAYVGGAFIPATLKVRKAGAWVTPDVNQYRSGAWVQI